MGAQAKRVRWGILSTALIGTQRVIPGMLKSREFDVAAIASRDLARAKDTAAALGIPVAYGSYDELLADPSIDAIYNPLPNHLHVPLTLAAARAGKHVLCEKPMALTAPELEATAAVHVEGAHPRSVHGAAPPAVARGARASARRRDRRAALHPCPL